MDVRNVEPQTVASETNHLTANPSLVHRYLYRPSFPYIYV